MLSILLAYCIGRIRVISKKQAAVNLGIHGDHKYIDMFCNIHVQPTRTPFYNLTGITLLHIAQRRRSLKRIHVILIALRPSSVHRFVGINGLCFLKPLDEASYEFLIEWVVDPSGAK